MSPIITNELGRKFYCAKKTVYWNDIHIFGRGSFYEERRQSEVYDKKLSTSERTTSFQNGSYSVSIKEGKVIKIKNKLVRLTKISDAFKNGSKTFVLFSYSYFELRESV